MASTIGHNDAFDETVEQWDTYIERFDRFINANDIKDEKQVSVRTYGLLRSSHQNGPETWLFSAL